MTRQEVKTQEAIFTAFFDLLAQNHFTIFALANYVRKLIFGRSTFL